MSINGSRQPPLVLEVEDLHWIDATSEEWLAALVEQVAGIPILVLVTYRSGYRPRWLDKSYATQLALQRLTPGDSLRLVQTVLHTAEVPVALAQAIVAKADGNPFFLEELARTVVEQGDRRLPPAAAVIGKDIALTLLQGLAGLPEEESCARPSGTCRRRSSSMRRAWSPSPPTPSSTS